QRARWKKALALIQAGEELKQQEGEDLEVRTSRKLFAGPMLKAIEVLEKFLEDDDDYAPAYLSLGVAYESLSHYDKAATAYRRFLAFGTRNDLPELEQQAQVRQRMIVCERRHQVDVELARQVPGLWQVAYDRGEERVTTTTVLSDKQSSTVTAPAYVV